MKYRVELTNNAQQDVDAAYKWLAERTAHAADWLDGLLTAIEGLSELPTGRGLARESKEFTEPVRQLLYGKSPHVYRVLFIVRARVVYVLHVRHGARQAMERSQVVFPPNA